MTERATKKRSGDTRGLPMKASTTIETGHMVGIDTAGLAVPLTAVATLKPAGVCEKTVANTGADAAATVEAKRGVYCFANSAAGDLIGRQHIGDPCYAVNATTVALTHATNTRPKAGTVFDVDAHGVWVEFA